MNVPHYDVIDRAQPGAEWVTLLHGSSQHSGLFESQIDDLGDRFRLLLIDFPGHGRSSHLAGPYGQVEYARAVVAALDVVDVQRTHLWGTHTGSAISLLIASQQPDRVSTLILEGAVLPGMRMRYVSRVIARVRATAREHGMAAARAEWFADCRWFDVMRGRPIECRADAHRDLLEAFTGDPWVGTLLPAEVPSLVGELSRIQQPALLVNGEFDVPEFLKVAAVLRSGLPCVRQIIVPGAGGFPLWEFPSIVNPLVVNFLAGHSGSQCR